jgi:hypothetical protein
MLFQSAKCCFLSRITFPGNVCESVVNGLDTGFGKYMVNKNSRIRQKRCQFDTDSGLLPRIGLQRCLLREIALRRFRGWHIKLGFAPVWLRYILCFFGSGLGLRFLSENMLKKTLGLLAGVGVALTGGTALAADLVYKEPGISLTDPTPVAAQRPAVDGINFKLGVITGAIGGNTNHMFIGSVTTPMPFFNSFGAQLDLGAGIYREDFTSAAAGLHLFYRDPDKGLLGIYGDWGYVNPEHAGRLGVEAAAYMGRWSLDVFAGVQFGQHVNTEFVDEIDLGYYFTDNFRGAVGHRLISRGHVANISFEYMPENAAGWSIYGEAEAGEDEYHSAWLGLRYSFGQSSANTLIERDRSADPLVRIPRNLASVTRCGDIQNVDDWHESWNGFETSYHENLCSDRKTLKKVGAKEGKTGDDEEDDG